MDGLKLRERQRVELEQQLCAAHDARVYRRTWALLQVDRGRSVRKVAKALGVARRTVQRWCGWWRSGKRAECLFDQPGRGRPPLLDGQARVILAQTLETPPYHHGYLAPGWTAPLLIEHLARSGFPRCSTDTLRRALFSMGIAWKRPRYRLEPDPEREKKKSHPGFAQALGPAGVGVF